MTRRIPTSITLACVLAATLGLLSPVAFAQDSDAPPPKASNLLADQTWSDPIYGVSLRPPLNAKLLPDEDYRSVARWQTPAGLNIRLAIHRNDEPVTLQALQRATLGEISFSDQEVQVDGRGIYSKVANRAGVVTIYHLADSKNRPAAGEAWVWESSLGLAMVQMDNRTVLVIEATSPAGLHQQLRGTLMQMLDHLHLDDAGDVAKRIQRMVSEGHIWRLSISPEDRRETLKEPRLMRVLRDGKDAGFMRINLVAPEQEKALGNKGTAVEVREFEMTPAGRIDRLATYFESDNRVEEIWSLRSTLRPNPKAGALEMASGPSTWSETGFRSDRTAGEQGGRRPMHDNIKPSLYNRLNVTREGAPPKTVLAYTNQTKPGRTSIYGATSDPRAGQRGFVPDEIDPKRLAPADPKAVPAGEVNHQGWPTPPQAYLSQIDLWTVLLFRAPSKQAERLAFYAYDPALADLSLHLIDVQPQDDGTSKVVVKASLSSPPRTYHYDAVGTLLKVDLPGNVTWVPATPGDLQSRWAGRELFEP